MLQTQVIEYTDDYANAHANTNSPASASKQHATLADTQQPPGLQALFDSLAHGIWVVDAACHLQYANPIAKQTMHAARCLKQQGKQLQAVHPRDQTAFIQCILKATQQTATGHSNGVRSVLRLRVQDTKPPTELLALVTPLQGAHSDPVLQICYDKYSKKGNKYASLAAIQLQKNTLIDPAMLCMLARSYQLTHTEELVLSLLCDGLDAPDVAQTLNVAVSTIRTHIRGLCEKMQAHGIRQLILKVAMLPGAAGVMGVV